MYWRSSFFFFVVAGLMLCTAITAQAELVNYWTFDSDGSDAVTGGSGTFVGDAAITNAAGEYAAGSGALKIAHNTATGDHFDIGYEVFPVDSVYTVTGWYKWDTSFSSEAVDQRGFIYETTPQWSGGVGFFTEDVSIYKAYETSFWAYNQSGGSILAHSMTSEPANDSAWHFFAITYDAVNDEAIYYHDGVATSSTGAALMAVQTDGLHIGDYRGGNGARNWQGYIDDFAVYEGIISGANINNLYSGMYTPETVPVPEPSVLALLAGLILTAVWFKRR